MTQTPGYGQSPYDNYGYGSSAPQGTSPSSAGAPSPSYGQAPSPSQSWVPTPPASPTPDPYGSAPESYGSVPPYAATPTYPTSAPHAYAPSVPMDPAPQKRPSTLGFIGLGVVVLAAIFVSFFAHRMGTIALDVLPESYWSSGNTTNIPDSAVDALGSPMLIIIAGSVVGIIGLVLGIVAAARNSGRTPGIVAIILGLLAPVIAFVIFTVTLAPAIS